jgi:hypothetical protein
VFEYNADDPLTRCKGESQRAADALQDYVLRGFSLRDLQAYYAEQQASNPHAKVPSVIASTIFTWSMRFKWQERKERFKEIEHARKRDEWRKRRVGLLEGFFGKTAKALDNFEGEDATLGQLTQAVKTAVQELRAEYDDLPTQRAELTGKDGGPMGLVILPKKDDGDAE